MGSPKVEGEWENLRWVSIGGLQNDAINNPMPSMLNRK